MDAPGGGSDCGHGERNCQRGSAPSLTLSIEILPNQPANDVARRRPPPPLPRAHGTGLMKMIIQIWNSNVDLPPPRVSKLSRCGGDPNASPRVLQFSRERVPPSGWTGGVHDAGRENWLSSFVFNLNLLTVGGSLVNSICFGLSGSVLDRCC